MYKLNNFKTKKSISQDIGLCQIKNKNNDTFRYAHINQKFWELKKFFSGKNDSYILVIMAIYSLKGARQKGICWASNQTIANLAGISKRHVNRVRKELAADGLLAFCNPWHTNRKPYRTNANRLSDAFYLPKVSEKIFFILKSCLSEYATLLKDSLVTLFRKKMHLFSKKSISLNTGANVIEFASKIEMPLTDPVAYLKKFFKKE